MGPRSSPFEEDGPSAGPGSTGETAEQKAREQKKGTRACDPNRLASKDKVFLFFGVI